MSANRVNTKKLTVTAIMSAAAFVLMILEFNVPLVPSFLKFDFSDLPAFITSFAVGPVWGVCVELIKNLLHLPMTSTTGVGELANFLVGSALVFPAGLICIKGKSRRSALIGASVGALFAAAVSFPVNYFITYPFYSNFMPIDQIVQMYHVIFPSIDSLPEALVKVNCTFTIIKGAINTVITFLIYKKISPILK